MDDRSTITIEETRRFLRAVSALAEQNTRPPQWIFDAVDRFHRQAGTTVARALGQLDRHRIPR
jgi:hypothetical protein